MKVMFLILTSIIVYNNSGAQGVIFDDQEYEKLPLQYLGEKSSVSKAYVSLRKYTPTPMHQRKCNSCSGWASAYACLSTALAIRDNVTDKRIINSRANSAMYPYVQVAPHCDSGSKIESILDILQVQGDCLLSDFNPSFGGNRSLLPYRDTIQELKSIALQYRIRGMERLFNANTNEEQKIIAVKRNLQNNHPVIISCRMYKSMLNVKGKDVWHLNDKDDSIIGPHAMCVVGYNSFNETFDIMNSWGVEWADSGFFSIGYYDLAKIVRYGYVLNIDNRINNETEIFGEVSIEKFVGWDNEKNKPMFVEVLPVLRSSEYWLENVTTKDQYRFIIKGVKKDCYLYMVSFKPSKDINLLHPPSGSSANLSSIVYSDDIITIPNDNNVIHPDMKGKDQIVILFSYNPIDNVNELLKKLHATLGVDAYSKLRKVFPGRVIDRNHIRNGKNRMTLYAKSTTEDIGILLLNLNIK